MNYIKNLILKATKVSRNAYVPYSKFRVGAAILTSDEKIYGGFNIENAAYSTCNCAERTALFRAVYDGYRSFKAIAIVGGNETNTEVFESYCPPCGVCRQILREFCNPKEFKVILAKNIDDFKIYMLEDLLPESFGPENLK